MSQGPSQALTTTGPQGVAEASWTGFDHEQVQLIKDLYCAGATDAEFRLFIQKCNHLKLSPFARQIYAVRRWNSTSKREELVDQVSIDGMRVIAERTGQYRGQTSPQWCGNNLVWREVWTSDKPPEAARCGVLRAGYDAPVYAVARYGSYVQTDRNGRPLKNWAKMPDVMLSKCAEALALRKAFPLDLSGVAPEGGMVHEASASVAAPSLLEVERDGSSPDDDGAHTTTSHVAAEVVSVSAAEQHSTDVAEQLARKLKDCHTVEHFTAVTEEIEAAGLTGVDRELVARCWKAQQARIEGALQQASDG